MEEVTYRKCPDCMHTIPSTAIVCMYCGATLGKNEKKSTSTLKKVGIGVVGFISLCFVLFVIAAIFVTPPERIDSNSTSSEERLAAAPTWTPTAVVVAVAEDQEPIVEDLPIDAPTPEPDIPTVVPTLVPVQPTGPIVNAEANLRSGPSTSYEIIGKARPGQSIDLEAKNQAGDWYQLASGAWIAGFLVDGVPEGLPIVEVAAPPAPVVPVAAPVVAATAPPAPTPVAPTTLDVHFLDVGQGDSTLLVGPDFTILIDAGRHNRNDVVPHLERIGITAIDLLVGTHPHADHIGQFPQVLERYPVVEVWMSGDTHTTLTFERALDAILASEAAYHEPRAGERYEIGSATVEVLNPLAVTGDLHAGSVSLRIVFGDVAFLFTGDAEVATEAAMVRRGHTLNAQVLQLGHHGSRTSSSSAVLRAVQPELAIWSAGKDNSYGHPHAEVLTRLKVMGVTVCGTAAYGTLTVRTDGQRYAVDDGECMQTERLATGTATPTPAASGAGAVSAPAIATTAPTATPAPTAMPQPAAPTSNCVNINTASVEEVQRIKHIGSERAADLIRLRPYTSVDQLERISGIGPARIRDIKAEGIACVN